MKAQVEMKNKKIAELVGKKIFEPSEDETDYAIQLLVEKLTMPSDIKSYSAKEAEKYILNALSKKVL
jgi:hypothetical protein